MQECDAVLSRCLDERFGLKRTWRRNTKYFHPDDVNPEVAVAFILGFRYESPAYAARCRELGIPYAVIDLGYMRREWGYMQVGVGGLNVAPPVAPSDDRFRALHLKVYSPRQILDPPNCMVLGQVPGDAQHDLTSERQITEWGSATIAKVRKILPPRTRLYWRPHPKFVCALPRPAISTDPLRPIIEHCKEACIQCAVTYNSTAAIELLRIGVHVVALGPRTVYTDLVPSTLDHRLISCHPGADEVRSLLERLAYGQYKLEELGRWSTFEKLFELHGVTGDW